jgi:membrane protease subunit HflC
MTPRTLITIAVIVVAVVAYMSIFYVDERERVILFQFGQVIEAEYEPGLHFKAPWQNVRRYDRRVLTLDARPSNYLTKEKKNVNVDFFVKWRINDVRAYYQTMSQGSERVAQDRIYTILNDGLRGEFSNRLIQEVISGERRAIMDTMTKQANEQVKDFGIEIVDVRIKRIDFTKQINESVYRRMEAERARVAKDLRSRGAEAAERIRAEADRQRTVVLAEAYKEAQKTRGTGDAKATEIYAEAFKKNPEFYSFYRSLEAYRKSFENSDAMMVLEPDSDFFKYFNEPKPGRKK